MDMEIVIMVVTEAVLGIHTTETNTLEVMAGTTTLGSADFTGMAIPFIENQGLITSI